MLLFALPSESRLCALGETIPVNPPLQVQSGGQVSAEMSPCYAWHAKLPFLLGFLCLIICLVPHHAQHHVTPPCGRTCSDADLVYCWSLFTRAEAL